MINVKIFGREPALWVALIGAALTWLAGFRFDWLNTGQATAITVFITGLIIALTTRPIAPGLFTGAVGAMAALFAEYGLHLSEEMVTGISGLILATFAFRARGQITPNNDPVPTTPANGPVR